MKLISIAVLYFVAVIVVAHFFSPPGYAWTQNTVSELASQGHARKWILQVGLIGFGVLLTGGLVWRSIELGRLNVPDVPILVYGLSILITGIFCAAPIDPGIPFSAQEARIHSWFATLAGFALVSGILWAMIVSPERSRFHLLFLLLVTGISMLFGLSEGGNIPIGKGIVQRLLYIVSFLWLVNL